MQGPTPRNQNLTCPVCGKTGFNNIFALTGHKNWHKRRAAGKLHVYRGGNKPKAVAAPAPSPAPTPPLAKRPYTRKTVAPTVKYCPECGCHIAAVALAITLGKGKE